MDNKQFRKYAHELADWMADYLENKENYPVKALVQPKEIFNQLPELPPESGEPFEKIFEDFQKIIMPGMTHWQSPNFFAYFPANSSAPSILAEMLTSTLAAQCMSWQTSPAATELEEQVMNWLKTMIGLPDNWSGVIQDTASTATLTAMLTAREKKTNFAINQKGYRPEHKFTIYCSDETHSSIEKGVKIAGFGTEQLRKINVDENFALIPEKLEEAIKADIENGFTPLCAIATLGTTGSTAIDPLEPIGRICRKYGLWLHIDAAFGGTALLLDEYRFMIKGIELAESFVFNPHKWMFTNFDCSAYFVKDEAALVRTFEILPEYLKTAEGDRVKNYRDWGIQLGRRFRALKLWFVIRTFGVEGLKTKIKSQIEMAAYLKHQLEQSQQFEIIGPVNFNLICFRYNPSGRSESELNQLNNQLLENLNNSGKIYLTHTKLAGKYVIRMQIGQTDVTLDHVKKAFELIKKTAEIL